jgi:hypothetical protein
MDALAQRLVELLGARGEAPTIVPLAVAAPPRCVVAVDGSSVKLAQPGGHLLAAFRAATVRLDRGRPTRDAAEPEIVLLGRDALDVVRERLGAAIDLPRLHPESGLDALRTIAELRAADRALDALERGDLLLLDGPLQERPAVPLMDALLAKARGRGVDVVGVCKSTSLLIGNAPALAACLVAARAGASGAWLSALVGPPTVRGRVFAARLNAAEPRAFRFDVSAADDDHARALGALAGLCGHPAYPGYPSPLAMAHNAAVLDDAARRRLLAAVEEAAIRAGVRPSDWEAACVDYHDVLEMGA